MSQLETFQKCKGAVEAHHVFVTDLTCNAPTFRTFHPSSSTILQPPHLTHLILRPTLQTEIPPIVLHSLDATAISPPRISALFSFRDRHDKDGLSNCQPQTCTQRHFLPCLCVVRHRARSHPLKTWRRAIKKTQAARCAAPALAIILITMFTNPFGRGLAKIGRNISQ